MPKLYHQFRQVVISRASYLAFLLYLLLSVIFTWPLIMHFSDKIIGPLFGDNLEYIWKIWWVKHALLELGRSPWIQPEIYAPYGYLLAYGEITPIHTFLGVPLTAVFGPVVAYNFFIVASFSLTGFFTYWYARELKLGYFAAFTAGAIFAFCPFRLARVSGHLPLIDTQWFPLMFLFLDRFISRPNSRDSIIFGLSYAASSLSSWYYGLMMGLLIPFYLWTRLRRDRRIDWRKWIKAGWPGVAGAFLLIIPFLIPYLRIGQLGMARIPLQQAVFWSASLTDYLIPNPLQLWWGEWVQTHLTLFPGGLPYEFILGFGFTPLLLTLYGWQKGSHDARRIWGWFIAIAIILSLGPVFKILGITFSMPIPSGLAKTMNYALDWMGMHSLVSENYSTPSLKGFQLPLPALLLRWYVPGLAGMRSWARFAVLACFGISVLSGIGMDCLLRGHRSHSGKPWLSSKLMATLLLMLVLIEFYTGPRDLITPAPRSVDHWLAAKPEKALIIQMPISVALSGPQMFYSMYHGQPVASGYGTYFPILFKMLYAPLESFPSNEALDILSQWGKDADQAISGVQYVLVDEKDVPINNPLWEQIAEQTRLVLIENIEGVRVYTIR